MIEGDHDGRCRSVDDAIIPRRSAAHAERVVRCGVHHRCGGSRRLLRAVRDPLLDRSDRRLRQRRSPERHGVAGDPARARNLLVHVTVGGITRLDPQDAGLLVARDTDQQRVAVGGIELQSFRRAGADVAARADRREYVVLNGLKVSGYAAARIAAAATATARADGLPVRVEPVAVAGAAGER